MTTGTDHADDAVSEAVSRLERAHREHQPVDPVRDIVSDVDTAYAVQERLTARRQAEGHRLVGRKIGLTSQAVQRQLGVDTPDFGMLFADMAVPDGAEVPFGAVLQPKAEAEVALVLQDDLTHERHTVVDLLRAVAYVLPAIEIVASRIRGWDISLVDTVADNASCGLYVLGSTPTPLHRAGDLRLAGMALHRRGDQVATGAGAACLGHPLNAALWLADTLVRVGRPLSAGDTVLTGALGPMVEVGPGDVLEARIEGLGSVRTAFAREEATS